MIKKINDFKKELLNSIKTIMNNNSLDQISISDCCNRITVVWWCDKGYVDESEVLIVKLKNNRLTLVVDSDEFGDIELDEGDFALQHLEWLNDIRACIIEALEQIHERICSECGKSMTEGYCVDQGAEYYCCDVCLHKKYSPEQWDEMCKGPEGNEEDGNDYCYWTQWEN